MQSQRMAPLLRGFCVLVYTLHADAAWHSKLSSETRAHDDYQPMDGIALSMIADRPDMQKRPY